MKWLRYICISAIVVSLCAISVFSVSKCPSCGSYYVDWTYYEGDCQTEGYEWIRCYDCGYYKRIRLGYGDCDYRVSASKSATCSSEGYKKYECRDCGDSYTLTLQIDPTAHNMSVVESVEPSYSSEGFERSVCSYCGYEKIVITGEKLCSHVYDEIGRVEATEDQAGSIAYQCAICGKIIYSELDYVSVVPSDTALLAKTVLNGVWGMTDVYVPGFSFTIRQLWLGMFMCSVSLIVIKLLFGVGGSGVASRTSSTNKAKTSPERERDEY